jgi:hypothetical protein
LSSLRTSSFMAQHSQSRPRCARSKETYIP